MASSFKLPSIPTSCKPMQAAMLFVLAVSSASVGCSRKFYRSRADQDVYSIYAEKRAEEAYTLPPLDGIDVDPRSRFFDPSPEDCPALPHPEPQLFGYMLPELETGDPNQPAPTPTVDQVPSGAIELLPPAPPTEELPAPVSASKESQIGMASFEDLVESEAESQSALDTAEPTKRGRENRIEVRLAELLADEENAPDAPQDLNQGVAPQGEEGVVEGEDFEGLRIVPIPGEYWGQLPESCVPRMLVFRSMQTEFRRSFPDAQANPVASLLSDAPRLTLPMIVELASFNNRAIQTQKERLYRAALVLTAERYEYLLRPTRRGNGTAVNYTHVRLNGASRSGLSIPTETTVRKTTAMAGQYLMSFANSVVMTFNGPDGFTANVATDLVFEFQQTIFQRDVVFEELTRAEREVVYEARDLIRAQRQLFVGLAGAYYDLLLRYRDVEIRSQDYFSNLRAFLQGRAEHLQAGRIPRVQVDQFEQNALGSRSNLVGACNSLETDLDELKLFIGLPPEMPLDLRLGELENLTTSDELTVTRQLVMRSRQTLVDASQFRLGDRDATVNGATVLVKRLIESLEVRRRIEGRTEPGEDDLQAENLEARLALLESRLRSELLASVRDQELGSELPPAPIRAFYRTMDLVDANLLQSRRAARLQSERDDVDLVRDLAEIETLEQRFEKLYEDWDLKIGDQQLDDLPLLVDEAGKLLKEADRSTKRLVGDLLPIDDKDLDDEILKTVGDVVRLVDRVETGEVGGLDEVTVQENEAMLLALFQRLDLMNQRGTLADARRQIKLRADDLKSILDINATQTLSLNRSLSQPLAPFDFSADGNVTRLSLALDTPLNRRIERNAYRSALIDYQASRRALIELEDEIKFDIREDLRQLRVRRNQYEISVASAALAYERVASTRLQLQYNVGNVVARDFLEAQQAYTQALRNVANDHISFIRSRIQLFFDTESIRLDSNGYWLAGQEESLDLPPIPDFYDANPNPYGRLPPCLKYSDEIRRNH